MKDAVLKIVSDLRGLADDLEIFAKFTREENIELKTKVNTKEKVISIENVREVLASKSQDGKQKEVKALIQKYGANKLTDLEPTCYKDLLKDAEEL
ncbi:rRNA biogenesis protein rrp5 [uncultured Clostridium sp.]|uniref:rRNA biogenesis protein rrp5 n=1 Tax=uncultured Clostridium sp. TaxID=59620 RepID=UPI0027DB459D|nr:rRNA biogenesis protein rrp5 [uncultured Clostridium sp.]